MKKVLLMVPVCLAPTMALESRESDTPSPHESILDSVHAVRDNDLHACLQAVLTDDQLVEMEEEWNRQRKEPIDPNDEAEFQAFMSMLVAPGAEDVLMEQLEPKLDEMRPQVSMMIGMFSGMAQSLLDQDTDMDPAEKARAKKVIEAMGQLLSENDVTSKDSAKKAIGFLCAAARRLEIDSLADIQSLTFKQLLAKCDVLLAASKDVLELYGVDLDEWMESVHAETVSENGETAVVRVSYEVLGFTETFDAEMIRVGSRWVRKEAVELTSHR